MNGGQPCQVISTINARLHNILRIISGFVILRIGIVNKLFQYFANKIIYFRIIYSFNVAYGSILNDVMAKIANNFYMDSSIQAR
jgi:hypothetical protein